MARVGLQRFLRLGLVKFGPFFLSFGPASSDFGVANAEGLFRRVLVDITFAFIGRESRHGRTGTRQSPVVDLVSMTPFLNGRFVPETCFRCQVFFNTKSREAAYGA